MLTKFKPNLAILNEDFPKLKNVISKDETNNLMNYLLAILNIKVSSPEEKMELNNQMVVIHDFLKTKFGNLTIPEIREAFKMYVAKEFSEIKVFRLLDCVSVGEVLTAYITFRNDALRLYDAKKKKILEALPEITESQKALRRENLLRLIFNDLTEKGFSLNAWHVFMELEDAGKLPMSLQEKKSLYYKQLRIYEIEEMAEIRGKHGTNAKAFLSDLHNKITAKGTVGSVVNKCRSITASNYLKNHIQDYETFKKEIG